MNERVLRLSRRYDTSMDRAGFALAAGSLIAGIAAAVLVWLGGTRDPAGIVIGWLLGTLVSAVAITAVGGPLWLVMHVAGLRRARHAAMVGATTALAIFVGAQTYGFGLFEMPPMDDRTLLYRWLSAIATSLILAVFAAIIALVMWRIAYRRTG